MESIYTSRFAWTLVAALLVALAPAGVAVAQESEQAIEEEAEEITLTGQLSIDDLEGNYVLIEAESGDSIIVRGPQDLAKHVGTTVKVTGMWAADEQGAKYFAASKVERV